MFRRKKSRLASMNLTRIFLYISPILAKKFKQKKVRFLRKSTLNLFRDIFSPPFCYFCTYLKLPIGFRNRTVSLTRTYKEDVKYLNYIKSYKGLKKNVELFRKKNLKNSNTPNFEKSFFFKMVKYRYTSFYWN